MKILFIHQNFPGQYRHLAAVLAQTKGWQVAALGDSKYITQRRGIPGVRLVGYSPPPGATQSTHHYVKPLEGAVRRGQAVVRACLELKKKGFTPEVIYAHPGWGEALFLKDIFPNAQVTLYCEFYYGAISRDVGFDPEFPSTLDDLCRVRIKNAASLLSMEAADRGISPTHWQRNVFPEFIRDRISVVHEGVDTDIVKPDPRAEVVLAGKNLALRPEDEVITYVARNLEPYRGYHIFMRALPEILQRRPGAHVLIVGANGVSYGQSPPKGKTYQQIYLDEVRKDIDLSRVHFLGQVPYETLLRVYQISSVHVYLTYPFVLSWSVLEAMASGCTIVASRTPPAEEVINDGENGFLVDFFSPSELAERIDQVMGQAEDVATVRERARTTVMDNFDLKRVCLPKHLDLLGIGPRQMSQTTPQAHDGNTDNRDSELR